VRGQAPGGGGRSPSEPGPIHANPIDPGWDRDDASEAAGTSAPPRPGPARPPKDDVQADLQPWTIGPGDASLFRFEPTAQPDDDKPPPSLVRIVPPSPPAPAPAPPPPPAPRPARPRAVENDPNRTIGIGKGLIAEALQRILMIQYYDGIRAWHNLEQLRPGKHVLGRSSFAAHLRDARFVAEEHVRFELEGGELIVEEGETINGAYRNVPQGRPVELLPGTRFQVGEHVIEFVPAETVDPSEPLVSPDGEAFRSRPLMVLGHLDFLGLDGRATARAPLTKAEGTIMGRDSKSSDIVLVGDELASRAHARIVFRDQRCYLEDLGSTNGTFVRISGRAPLRTGRAQSATASDVLLIGAILIRVVEM
jgi:pSer/pThr/pTyr-binding forkhead associated (FHA) protein